MINSIHHTKKQTGKHILMKQRIDYIDLAKGICILLVLLNHTFGPLNKTGVNTMLGCFRMPLYFFLSGLFFNNYSGFINFALKKTNKLIIPFLFFITITYLFFIAEWTYMGHYSKIETIFPDIYNNIQTEYVYLNPPIWFLLSLFETSVLFYLLFIVSNKLTIKKGGKKFIMAILCFSVGIIGYELSVYHINLPLWLDTSMTALPFYYLGYFFREETEFLAPNKFDKYIPFFLVICGGIVYFLAGRIEMVINVYHESCFSFYTSAISGILFVLLFSKLIIKLPVISFLGRYSIIVLGTHWVLLYVLGYFITFITNSWLLSAVLFVIVVFAEIPVIKILLRFFPKFVCQEDLITIDSLIPAKKAIKESKQNEL